MLRLSPSRRHRAVSRKGRLGSGPIRIPRDKFMIHRSEGGRLMIRDYFWLSDDQFARFSRFADGHAG